MVKRVAMWTVKRALRKALLAVSVWRRWSPSW
jgi:hypothetical protein